MLPFCLDGTTCFYSVSILSDEESSTLPRIELTSDKKHDPNHCIHPLLLKKTQGIYLWKNSLGFIPIILVSKSLSATTEMVPNIKTETNKIMKKNLKTKTPQLKRSGSITTCVVTCFSCLLKKLEPNVYTSKSASLKVVLRCNHV